MRNEPVPAFIGGVVLLASLALFSLASCTSPSKPFAQPETEHGNVEATDAARPTCGVERWSVKLLRDTDVSKVNLTPADTTVDQLRALSVPRNLPRNSRIAPEELQVYRVHVTLIKAAREADSDYHIVIADPTDGQTMIAEIPDAATCGQGTDPAFVSRMETARQAFDTTFGAPPSSVQGFEPLHGTATIVGPAFVDSVHGQSGVALNGIEIHPVLDITFGN